MKKRTAVNGALPGTTTDQDVASVTVPDDEMTSAPRTVRAVGRCVQTLASHAPIAAIIALALALASYRPRQCFNANRQPKVRHKSRDDAIAHKRALIMAGRASKWLQVYQCRVCGFWHVGHRGGRRG